MFWVGYVKPVPQRLVLHNIKYQYSWSTSAGQPDWQVLVRRFRSLRATLVSHADLSLFAAQVYLLSTDVSLHAADHAECLKSLQALVQQLLPALFTEATRPDDVTSQSAQQPAQTVGLLSTPYLHAWRASMSSTTSHKQTRPILVFKLVELCRNKSLKMLLAGLLVPTCCPILTQRCARCVSCLRLLSLTQCCVIKCSLRS